MAAERPAPTVSVVIPTFNRGALLDEAIHSVLAQTFDDLELIVVDDGSTDDTRRRVEAHRDPRVRYLHQRNTGLAAARNAGIQAARGSYVAFLDDDDSWQPDKLRRQMELLSARPDVAAVHTGFRWVDQRGAPLDMEYRRPRSRGSLYEDLMFGNVISGSGSSVLVRASCFGKAGMFDPALRAREDQDLWRRLALAGCEFACVDEPLVHIRWHETNMQKDAGRMASAGLQYLAKLRAEAPLRFRHVLTDVAFDTYRTGALAFVEAGRLGSAIPYVARAASLGPGRFLRIALEVARLATWRTVQRAANRLSTIRRSALGRAR